MTQDTLAEELREERRRNLEDAIRHARWKALMVKKLGRKWFEARDKWLIQAWTVDREMWRDPRIREALIKSILARDKAKQRRDPKH
ncbi:MAG: hypothetical protein GSR73_02675 [Desulfurococcales archaeon]|nr:hypothetical protein [Desulfurococcales archaeon]